MFDTLWAYMPLNLGTMLICIIAVFFTYQPFYEWFDRATRHPQLGMYVFCCIGSFILMILSLFLKNARTLEGFLYVISCLLLMPPLMALAREYQYMKRGKENVIPKLPPDPDAPPPPPEPTTEEKIEALLKENKR